MSRRVPPISEKRLRLMTDAGLTIKQMALATGWCYSDVALIKRTLGVNTHISRGAPTTSEKELRMLSRQRATMQKMSELLGIEYKAIATCCRAIGITPVRPARPKKAALKPRVRGEDLPDGPIRVIKPCSAVPAELVRVARTAGAHNPWGAL